MLLSELTANRIVEADEPKHSLQDLKDALSKIFNDENETQDDSVKLKGLDTSADDKIEIDVETLEGEIDLSYTVTVTGNRAHVSNSDGESENIALKGSPEDAAYSILATISTNAEEYAHARMREREDEDDHERGGDDEYN